MTNLYCRIHGHLVSPDGCYCERCGVRFGRKIRGIESKRFDFGDPYKKRVVRSLDDLLESGRRKS